MGIGQTADFFDELLRLQVFDASFNANTVFVDAVTA
jgi:hypothetical protein